MTDDIPDAVGEVNDYPVRKRIGGLVSIVGIATIALFFDSGRTGTIPLAESLGFTEARILGILFGLLAITVGVAIALSGYVTD